MKWWIELYVWRGLWVGANLFQHDNEYHQLVNYLVNPIGTMHIIHILMAGIR